MSDWNIGRLFRIGVAYFVGVYTGNWALLASQMSREAASVKAAKARRRAIQQYNDAVQDRLEMLDLQPDAPRTLVLGRVRYVEGVRRRWTSGTNDEKLTMIVSFAGHEIDAFESWYLDDMPVTLDGSGYVTEAPYRKTETVDYNTTGSTADGSGAATVVLPATPSNPGDVAAIWWSGAGHSMENGTATVVSVVGATVTISGAQAGSNVSVVYQGTVTTSYVRIRPYLGTPTQNVGFDLAAEYPAELDAADEFQGIALAVVDITYNPDVFPQGRPSVTAVMRGAKCYDPRSTLTVWTENPALHALKYATWTHGWALTASDYVMADITAAANVCDVSTVFPLSTGNVTLVRHRCGITIDAAADHAEAMDAIMETMNGRHGWAGGQWRLRAGTLGSTAATITQDWLVSDNSGGEPSGEPVITAVQALPRTQRINRVTGSCVDPAQRYQLLPFPAVEDAVLISTYGERAVDVQFSGVNHIAHAQHLASMAIRQAQAGLRVELTLNENAARLELFDVVALTMARYGFSAKTFEVVGWTWTQAGAYKVTLSEITAAMFTVEAALTGRDPAPDSTLRPPWDVEAITGLAVTSGTTATLDGSVLTRTTLTWDAVVGESIRRGGSIEVQYALASDTLPAGDWPSWIEQGTSTGTTIPGLLAGRNYLFRVRAVQGQPLVRGPWSASVLHQVAAAPVVSGQYTEFVFKRAATIPATPTGDTPAGWSDAPPVADGNPLWFSAGQKTSAGALIGVWTTPVQLEGAGVEVEYSINGTTLWHSTFTTGDIYARYSTDGGGTWSAAVKIVGEDGADGEDGGYFDYVFKRAASAPATPTGDTPVGWSDGPPAADGNPLWMSTATKTAAGVLVGAWTTPVQIEADGLQIEYSANGTTGWDATYTDGVDFYARYSKDGGATWTAGIQIVGEGGVTATMSNGAHVLPASTTGVVSSYVGSGTEIRVVEGGEALAYQSPGTAAGTWTIASTSATNITVGSITDSGIYATVGVHSGVASGTDTASIVYTITGTTWAGVAFTITQTQTFSKSKTGADGVAAVSATLSRYAHVFPASTTGVVSSYTGSGTEIRVLEGTTALAYDGVGTASGTWTFSSSATNITRGSITDSGTYATVGDHSGVADGTDASSIVYTITGKTAAAVAFTVILTQSFSKSKTGATGSTGGTGATGQSNHRIYKAVTIGSPPATPGTTTSGATPATWSATPLTLTVGQEQYQSDGTTPAGSTTTTWGTPYPSYLKVGNLAAISADLGSITAGNITLDASGYIRGGQTAYATGTGFYLGYSGSSYVLSIGSGSDMLRWDGTRLSAPSNWQNSLCDSSWWAPGVTLLWPAYNGTSATTTIVVEELPDNETLGPTLRALDSIGNSAAGGGTTGSETATQAPYWRIDRTRTYMYAVYVKRVAGNGTFYFGPNINGTAQIATINTDTTTSNPYFVLAAAALLTVDTWYLAVGYVFPAGTTGHSSTGAGLYDCTTGIKVASATALNFCWKSTAETSSIKFWQFGATTAGTDYRFAAPAAYLADGSEPALSDLLSMATLSGRNPITSGNAGTYITVDNLSAISADLGTITAGTVTGALIRTAASGSRAEMDVNGVRVYNSSTLVGRIGPASTVAVVETIGTATLYGIYGTSAGGLTAIFGNNTSSGAGVTGQAVTGDAVYGEASSGRGAQFARTNNGIAVKIATSAYAIEATGGYPIRTDHQLQSTIATGTAPLTVSSTTVVSNLNADTVDGEHATGLVKSIGANRAELGNTTTSSGGNIAFSGTTKPGTTQGGANQVWVEYRHGGNTYWIPAWAD